MEIGITLGLEIALVIGVISVILFQLSGNDEGKKKQKIPAGVIIGIYILLFGVIAILLLPYAVKSTLAFELKIGEEFSLYNRISITADAEESLINSIMLYSSSTLMIVLFLTFIKYEDRVARTNLKATVLTALAVVLAATFFYGIFTRYFYKLQPTIWMHVIFIIYNIIVIYWSNKFVRQMIDQATNECGETIVDK